jgi:hypothetical protein
MRRQLGAFAVGALVVLTLAGCGSNDAAQGVGSTDGSLAASPSAVTTSNLIPNSTAATDTSLAEHQATHVVAAGNGTLTLDYLQVLTGKAAEKAAKERGDTVKDDRYLINDDHTLRTYPVWDKAEIVVHTSSSVEGTSRRFTFPEFRALVQSGSANYMGMTYTVRSDDIFFVDVEQGRITELEYQFVAY